MVSEENIEFLQKENRRYILGANKAQLKKFEQELLKEEWSKIREGIEVKNYGSSHILVAPVGE